MNALLGTKKNPAFQSDGELEYILSKTARKVFNFD